MPQPAPGMRVPVELGARRYDILIGEHLIEDAGAQIARLFPGSACAIVTDRNVAERHLPSLEAGLDMAGIRHTRCILEPGEATKSYEHFSTVCDAIIEARMERRDLVIALGGGVIGDMAGLAHALDQVVGHLLVIFDQQEAHVGFSYRLRATASWARMSASEWSQ